MQFKTIVLELLLARPQIYEELRKQRKLPEALDRYSNQLSESHDLWKNYLTGLRPGSGETIASEALELAIQELVDSLPASPPSDDDPSPEPATASPPA